MRVHISAKSVALTVLELLAFNAQKLRGRVTLVSPFFGKFLRDYVRTVPGNVLVKFEIRSFNRFKLVWLTGPLRTDTDRQTDRQTHIEQNQYLRHSLRSLGGDNKGTIKESRWGWKSDKQPSNRVKALGSAMINARGQESIKLGVAWQPANGRLMSTVIRDSVSHGSTDVWATVVETFRRQKGNVTALTPIEQPQMR